MPPSSHIAPEDLLLWQTGELSPEEAEAVRAHLKECKYCQRELEELEDFSIEAEWANTRVTERRMRARIEKRERHPFLWRLRPVLEAIQLHRVWASVTATTVIAALLLVSIGNFTPAARADVILRKAVRQEQEAGFHPRLLQVKEGAAVCSIRMTAPASHTLLASSQQPFCNSIARYLQGTTWTWSSLLSAKSFEQWRSSLQDKKDSIQKLGAETEVATSTDNGPIRRASLRIRNSDYHPTEARLQFAGTDDEVEITEGSMETDAIETASTAAINKTHVDAKTPDAAVAQRDEAEAIVRLALHRLDLDKSVLLAVETGISGVRIWGVVPDEAAKASFAQAVNGLPQVENSVLTGAEQLRARQPLPWQTPHGTQPPLALEQLNLLFADNPEGLQSFQNDVDEITARLVGEARNRDGLLALLKREPSSSSAPSLQKAVLELGSSMATDQKLLQGKLQPLLGMPSGEIHPLTYQQAVNVYRLTHALVIASDGRTDSTTLAQATSRMQRFLR